MQRQSLSTRRQILDVIDAIDPVQYGKTRNYLNGAVTWLSPYITHGIVSTQTIGTRLCQKHSKKVCYRLLFELAWREYFHRVWQKNGHAIFNDMKHAQSGVVSDCLPQAIEQASTGISTLDRGLETLFKTGFMHNHLRMWIAGTACNIAHTHWYQPAKWMHYHLLDGDLASNTLSWQWIAGTFSHKQYIANQANINKYSRSEQHDTWLDVDYETLADMPIPEVLTTRVDSLALPQTALGIPVPSRVPRHVALHSLWNLNADWLPDNDTHQRVLFIEKEHIDAWPMAPHRWEFIAHWAELLKLDIWLGSVSELQTLQQEGTGFIREEYPACNHWPGQVTERTFYFKDPEKSYQSFSKFWKHVQ